MIKPLGNRLLVKRLPLPDQTTSGLFLLGREYPTIGEVLAVGNGRATRKGRIKADANTISVGDKVQFSREAIRRNQEIDKDLIILEADQCQLLIKD